MKRNAVICLQLSSGKEVEILLKALLPETKKLITSRSKVSIEGEGKKLTIRIVARDTSALRAALNSYLRWVALIRDTYTAAVNLENASKCENT
ncbi:MAG: KEOPS complex subunit Pcc1 [Candidatus Bathyarchaeia archaeon]